MLFGVGLVVVCCLLIPVCCDLLRSLLVGWLLFVVCLIVVFRLRLVVCYVFVVYCVLFVVCWLMVVVGCCLLFDVDVGG